MVRYFFYFLLVVLAFFGNCQGDAAKEAGKAVNALPRDTLTRMTVALEDLQLRATPGTDQPVVTQLTKGMELETTGGISPSKTSIQIRGVQRKEPWIEVKTKDEKTGWVFGGGVKVEGSQNTPVASVLRKERLSSFFGPERTKQILQYRADYHSVENARDLENVFIRGTILRDSLTDILVKKIEITDHEMLPEITWLEDAMPGYKLQMVSEGSAYYLFQDYRKMKQWAAGTVATEDDLFFEFIKFVYDDEVEGFYPVWFEQTWDYGGFSLLGEGKHLSVLTRMEELMEKQKLFRNPILKIKMRLLKDILKPFTADYAAPAEKINAEVDKILSADFMVLSKTEKNNLVTRKQQFLEPAKYGLKLNLKSTNQ